MRGRDREAIRRTNGMEIRLRREVVVLGTSSGDIGELHGKPRPVMIRQIEQIENVLIANVPIAEEE